MTQKIAPALVAGCTVIMKPSPETPLEAYIIAEAPRKRRASRPAWSTWCPAHREASDHLVAQSGRRQGGFTGSTAAGRRIAAVCAERVARCTLELGGKSAAIVLDDFPIEEAATHPDGHHRTMTGQVCAMLSRVIVPRGATTSAGNAHRGQMAAMQRGRPR